MRFSFFKQFKAYGSTPSIEEIFQYIRNDLGLILKELTVGLQTLSFEDNFDSFQVDVTIESGAELKIRNELRDREVTQWIKVRGNDYSRDIVDGDTEWDLNSVYLKNLGAGTATATILFMR